MAQYLPNADIWFEIDWRLHRRPPESCLVTKVKGHASQVDVDKGVISDLDAWGNAGADWVAQYAARNCDSTVLHTPQAWLSDGR